MTRDTKRALKRILAAFTLRNFQNDCDVFYIARYKGQFEALPDVSRSLVFKFRLLFDAAKEEILRQGLTSGEILREFYTINAGARYLDNMHGFKVSNLWLDKAACCNTVKQAEKVIHDSSARREVVKLIRSELENLN